MVRNCHFLDDCQRGFLRGGSGPRYREALCSADNSIGAVMDQLKKMGIHDETLVIYMGDIGFLFGEHGLIDKRVAYENSIRVPMLMQCPELFKGGTVVDEVVANTDIAPTIMEAMGLEKPTHMDGQSFISSADGKEMEKNLFAMTDELGRMETPMNAPGGWPPKQKRLRSRGGVKAADFPEAMIIDGPERFFKRHSKKKESK